MCPHRVRTCTHTCVLFLPFGHKWEHLTHTALCLAFVYLINTNISRVSFYTNAQRAFSFFLRLRVIPFCAVPCIFLTSIPQTGDYLRSVLLLSPFYREGTEVLRDSLASPWLLGRRALAWELHALNHKLDSPPPPGLVSSFLPHFHTLSNYHATLLFMQITHIYKP